jgi:hypothetical protein
VVIRAAEPAEAPTLARFAERTFREAFAADNRPEDMDAYCATAFAPEMMRSHVSDASITTLVMVTEDGALAAYAQLRPESPDHVSGCQTRSNSGVSTSTRCIMAAALPTG